MQARVNTYYIHRVFYIFLILSSIYYTGCGNQHKKFGIVSIGPNITEILFQIGAGEKVIAIGDFDDYPPEIQHLPKVGTYISPNIEKITSLNPEIIVTAGEIPQLSSLANEIKIKYYSISMDTLEGIYNGITKLGELTNQQSRAQKLIEEMKNKFKYTEEKIKNFEPVPTLLVVGREPRDLSSIQVAGGNSFLSEILKIAGGKNVFEEETRPYFEISAEAIISKAPQAIIEFRCGESLTQKQLDYLFLDWKAFDTVPAVKNSRIYFILESYGMRPGPRLPRVAEKIASYLHPEFDLIR
ncbi:MAG: ABC transporter substrate-binding protein [Candidatus Hydrogenedentes bacterium]|nr:ABC transporter substrate-binding protein [Candidatus Hydrogenedentota bacterium]